MNTHAGRTTIFNDTLYWEYTLRVAHRVVALPNGTPQDIFVLEQVNPNGPITYQDWLAGVSGS